MKVLRDRPLTPELSVKSPKGFISARCATLDAAIGKPGLPLGRISVLTGPESAGKTTLALHLCAEVQAMGGVAVYYDSECKLDPNYAKALGVNLDHLIVPTAESEKVMYLEAVMSDLDTKIEKAAVTAPDLPMVVILDSINGTLTKEEWEGGFEDEFYAPRAKVFSKRLPKLVWALAKSSVALVFISQIREKINSYGYGPQTIKVSGGRAPRHFSTLVVDMAITGQDKEADRVVGVHVKGKVIKNQLSAPFREAEWHLRWGLGIDRLRALLDHAVNIDLVKLGSSGWYELSNVDSETGQIEIVKCQGVWGKRGFAVMAQSDPELVPKLEVQVRARNKDLGLA